MLPNNNILGIDVAKDELVIFDTGNQSIISCQNNQPSIEQALINSGWCPADYTVGLESTGDYSLVPIRTFLEHGFTVRVLNPIVTKKYINATVRKKKTDQSDAQAIALLVLHGEGYEATKESLDTAKKTLLRLEQKLVQISSDLKRLSGSLKRKSDNGLKQLLPAEAEIQSLIETVEGTAKRILNSAKSQPSDRQETIIASHVGCGEKLSTIISAEAGDIKRFAGAKQFKAYVGIDPRVIQSGNKNVKGKMTKRGNPLLRHALHLAAFVASHHDPELKAFYEKKRKEGKSHTHALCTIVRKMCERIYATVTQDRLYEVRKLSTATAT